MKPNSRTTLRGQVLTAVLAATSIPACSSTGDRPFGGGEGQAIDTGADNASAHVPTTTQHLFILNQNGDPSLEDFFDCMLGGSNWNTLALAYPGARKLSLAKQVLAQSDASGAYPCTSPVGSQAYYQCAIDAGGFDMAANDILLVVRPDGQVGGLDNQYSSDPTNISYGPNGGTMSAVNPVTHATIAIVAAHVGNATIHPEDLFVYAGHEVFEAQTDGVSADCCDGETASGGPLPVCPDCGPDTNPEGSYGACGQYSAPGGSWGIASITCPSGRTYNYQRVSPPGAPEYGSPEFDGTCDAIVPTGPANNPCAAVPSSANGTYCGASTEAGFDPTKAVAADLYDCENGGVASALSCAAGCIVAPAGQADSCNPDPCAKVPARGDGTYCGGDDVSGFSGGTRGTLYDCEAGGTAKMTVCPHGCTIAPVGDPDRCAP